MYSLDCAILKWQSVSLTDVRTHPSYTEASLQQIIKLLYVDLSTVRNHGKRDRIIYDNFISPLNFEMILEGSKLQYF